ncbi:DUF7344 domain-containing protein [Halorussus litoreus]|uniref:DUF7344 domain-containing protein n=1 Tax=Halorussus litoreus TaxID=1710536 RepID=UPI000E23731F|nr:hypothetical protein [Halorussus litoreus]
MGGDDAGESDRGDREPDSDDWTAESETGVSGGEDGHSPQVSDEVDALFDALADEHRRLVLYYLRDRESADLDELATVVSGWLQARAPDHDMVTPDDREGVRTALHHVQLPRLADTSFVSYDREAQVATLTGTTDLLAPILDQSLADDRRAVGSVDGRRGPGGDRS